MVDLHEVAEPLLFGAIPPVMIVSAAMTVLIAIMLWKKVPAMISGALDTQISAIRAQLDEAKSLRAQAEQLRAEYAARIASAEQDAAAMIDHARHEAEAIVARAHASTTDVIARREKMAADKIAAAEHAAVDELRRRAVTAATGAAAQLIAARLDVAVAAESIVVVCKRSIVRHFQRDELSGIKRRPTPHGNHSLSPCSAVRLHAVDDVLFNRIRVYLVENCGGHVSALECILDS